MLVQADLRATDSRWCLRQSAFDPERLPRDASLFALANGSLGVRGNLEELSGASEGCFLAGVHERHAIEYHERLPGFARNTDTRVPVADGTRILLQLGDDAIDPAECEWLDFERVLDFRAGALRRRSILLTPHGATIRIDSERVVPLAEDMPPDGVSKDMLSLRFRVTSIDYTGTVTLASTMLAGKSAAAQGEDPRIGVASGGALHTSAGRIDDAVAVLTQRTRRSGIALACAQRHRLVGDGLRFLDCAGDSERAVQRYRATMRPGDCIGLDKFVAYASAGGSPDVDDLSRRATALATRAVDEGHDALAAAQARTLAAFWRDADIDVEDDAGTAAALRFNLFHLMQSANRSTGHGTAAKGVTGEGYEGHCFWDTEVFVLPVMVFTAPHLARAMLGYRYRTLDAARANARELNHADGALYPWRTITGSECSAHYPSGSAAYHINADIAFAIGLYLDATGDTEFLLGEGAEMLFETARIWPQAGHFDPLRGGAFGIHCVTGPDEYTAMVDNNFYTNRMAQRHLQRAVAVWEQLSVSHPQQLAALAARLSLSTAEVDLWRRAAGAMLLPLDDTLDIHTQDDTFLHKPRWDFAAHGGGRPLLLDCHPLTLYRHQVCKQADVVMAYVLAGDGFDAALKRRSFDYYEPITTHDSTLSSAIYGIVASELGLDAQALDFFDSALRVDLDDLHGNTGHGVHMAAMAGSWLGIVWGFAGMRVIDGALHFSPTLPAGWRSYAFGLRWQGRRLNIRIDGQGTCYTLASGDAARSDAAPLPINHNGAIHELHAGRVLRSPLRTNQSPVDQTRHADAGANQATFPRRCEALIFDLDGVLTDTAHVHYTAWKKLADEIGVPFDETVNQRLKGVDRMASLEIILELATKPFGADEKQAFADRKNADYVRAIGNFGPGDLFAGVRELLASARNAGLRIALASASRNAGALVDRLGIADAFDVVVDAATITHAKPAPDIFLAAAHALGVAPSACIGIEDATAGVDAIKAAGMASIGIGDAREVGHADAVRPTIGAVRLQDFVLMPSGTSYVPSTDRASTSP